MAHAQIDHDAARELELYAYNTSGIYRQYLSIRDNVARRIKAGTYDAEKAPRLWLYWIDNAARNYCREFGGEMRTSFPKATRQYVAERVAISEWGETVEEVAHELADAMIQASEAAKRGDKGAAAAYRKAKDAADRASLYPGCLSKHIHEAIIKYS